MKANAQSANPPSPNPKAQANRASQQPPDRRSPALIPFFSISYGIFLGLCLLKLPNPPLFEQWTTTPQNGYEVLFSAWPISWAYAGLAIITITGLFVAKWPATPKSGWLIASLLAWWMWQVVATVRSMDDSLSTATLKHLTAVVICFLLGFCSLSRIRNLWPFWTGIFAALL